MRLWKGWASTGECWARSWSMQRVSRAEINIAEMEVSSLQSCPIMFRYCCEDHAGCSPDCSVHRPHLGNYKASKSFRFYNRCVYCFVLSMCAIMPGPGHGAKYRPGQWPDIPETEVLQIFATIASEHFDLWLSVSNVLFQGQRRTRFWSHQVGVVRLSGVGVGNIFADRDYILIVVQLAADHLLNTAEQAREGWTVNSALNR